MTSLLMLLILAGELLLIAACVVLGVVFFFLNVFVGEPGKPSAPEPKKPVQRPRPPLEQRAGYRLGRALRNLGAPR